MSLVGKDYKLTIASRPQNISEIEAFIEEIRADNELKDELYGNILISLTEAVNNCILHGNLCDPKKEVQVACNVKDNLMTFIISDQGNGFDYEHLPDPTAPENIGKFNGRGVFLMKQLSDMLIYSNGGSTVEMQFKI